MIAKFGNAIIGIVCMVCALVAIKIELFGAAMILILCAAVNFTLAGEKR